MSDLRSKLFNALTGGEADVSGQPGGDLAGMLMAVGGRSDRTRSGIDLTKAAAALGVSRRTVERWAKTAETGTGQRPSAAHAKTLASRARQMATTKRGRRAAVTRQAPLPRGAGAQIQITGVQGPPDPQRKGYRRLRTTQIDLTPDEAQDMIDAWVDGGDKGLMTWFTGKWDAYYVPDWEFETLDGIDIRPVR